jgi:hypothetical protein
LKFVLEARLADVPASFGSPVMIAGGRFAGKPPETHGKTRHLPRVNII